MSEVKEPNVTTTSEHGVSAHLTTIQRPPHLTPQQEKNKIVAEIAIVAGSEAITEAKLKEPVKLFTSSAMLIYVCGFVGFFCSTCNGFDGSMFGSLLTNQHFKDYYRVGSTGAWAGIVTSMYQIGGVVVLPFIGPACDTWGRKVGMIVGGVLGCVGVIIQATAPASNPIGQCKFCQSAECI